VANKTVFNSQVVLFMCEVGCNVCIFVVNWMKSVCPV
jgi:hypothetical protein